MLGKCGIQFERRYLNGERVPPGVGAVVGTATDRSVNADLASKLETGSLLSGEEVKQIARDTLVSEWANGVAEDGDFEKVGQGEAIDAAVACATLHHEQAAPGITPTHLQRKWTLDMKGSDIQLAGAIDIQEARKVRDTKTSKKSPSADEAHRSIQLTTYALAVKVLDGKLPESVHLDYLVKLKTPKLVQLEAKRGLDDFQHLFRRIEQAEKIIRSGLFTPAPLDAWWCSVKWCGFHATCPYARKPVSVSVPAPTPINEDLLPILKASLDAVNKRKAKTNGNDSSAA